MRITGRNWPFWLLGAATVWFVAIVAFWAIRPLDDHVPTTVAHVAMRTTRALGRVSGRSSAPHSTYQLCSAGAHSATTR